MRKMLVGLHENLYGKPDPIMDGYELILKHNNIPYVRLDSSSSDFLERSRGLDLFIYRWKHFDSEREIARTVLPIVENVLGVKCFPNTATWWVYDDKIREYLLMKAKGFPMVESWFFWDRKNALQWIKTADYPIVFKLKGGASSNGVVLVKNRRTAGKLVKRMFGAGIKAGRIPLRNATQWKGFSLYKYIRHKGGNMLRRLRKEDPELCWARHKNYALFQRFLPGNSYDTRVTIIGDRAFAFRRFNRHNDFRSSGSGKINYDMTQIDQHFIQIAFDVSKSIGFQSMTYDFLYDENRKPCFCEISYTHVDRPIYECPGYWDTALRWHEGHFWPQILHLTDCLGIETLRHPQIAE